MESNKSKGNRRGNNRRRGGGNKENKMREMERMMKKSRSEESILWNYPVSSDNESKTDVAEQETSLDLENFDNGKFPFLLLLSRRTQLRLNRCI